MNIGTEIDNWYYIVCNDWTGRELPNQNMTNWVFIDATNKMIFLPWLGWLLSAAGDSVLFHIWSCCLGRPDHCSVFCSNCHLGLLTDNWTQLFIIHCDPLLVLQHNEPPSPRHFSSTQIDPHHSIPCLTMTSNILATSNIIQFMKYYLLNNQHF